jgi:hypothetical protein
VFQVIGNDATVLTTLVPFRAEADLLGSSTHAAAPGTLGILRADRAGSDLRIVFQALTAGAPPTPNPVGIAGKITYHATGAPLGGVSVALLQNGSVISQTTTGADGTYAFSGLTAGAAYRVKPAFGGAHAGAISSLDASRILQTVAGTTSLSPIARLAGDTTGNGSLSSLDATRIAARGRRLPEPARGRSVRHSLALLGRLRPGGDCAGIFGRPMRDGRAVVRVARCERGERRPRGGADRRRDGKLRALNHHPSVLSSRRPN